MLLYLAPEIEVHANIVFLNRDVARDRAHRIKILTSSEEHEFKLVDKKQLGRLLRLVRRVLPENKIIA